MAIFEENEKEFNASMGEDIIVTPLEVTELEDIRKGYDGRKYASAGQAVRSQVDNLHQRVDEVQEMYDELLMDEVVSQESTWTSERIVERLCPAFSESGTVVSCTPVFGSKVEVITHLPETEDGTESLTLHHTGKNLLKLSNKCKSKTENGVTFTVNADGSITIQTSSGGATAATILILCGDGLGTQAADIFEMGWRQKVNYTLSVQTPLPDGVICQQYYYRDDGTQVTMAQFSAGKSSIKLVFNTATRFYSYLIVSGGTLLTEPITIYPMLEEGDVMTEYEPYCGEVKTVNFGTPIYGGNYNWTTGLLTEDNGHMHRFKRQAIRGHSGENYLFSSPGSTEVSGNADPNAIIEKLTNAIISLGGNV